MIRTRSLARRTALVATALATGLVLAACGSNDNGDGGGNGHAGHSSASKPPATGAHNAADVSFAQSMIPHHRQAVEMADLAPSRASSGEIKDLAEKIKKAQDPEIETMSGWLKGWHEQVPGDSMPGMDHSGHAGMPGMMSEKDMAGLKAAKGADFDKRFAELMIAHHKGAVSMAKTERKDGRDPAAKKLAADVIKTQSAEIEDLRTLLDRL
ncbi:DUF305 domain-containing protein [Streptomyces sp. Ru73]|uniref:DUF305 domain-containing protein n=1 Tax=Streptomyces sp. Ru73 TaxID=2080748 RepID=UPI000CDD7F8D|nr:DUF305 domain-containing protein [Streptomyces sp. Ru73]POX37084.1 DUF305 domain-containing protein [Streptomyces sp. Ru73]